MALPQGEDEKALKMLVEQIHARKDHVTTGIFGTKYLLEVLSQHGLSDLACKLAGQKGDSLNHGVLVPVNSSATILLAGGVKHEVDSGVHRYTVKWPGVAPVSVIPYFFSFGSL